MKKLNLVVVFNKDFTKVLMCKRVKEPFKGKYNFPGGKVEEGESALKAAKRELLEETGLDLNLIHLMDMKYYIEDEIIEVFTGKSESEEVKEEINPLKWIEIEKENIFGENFAGFGNCGHIVEIALLHKEEIKKESEN